jgi:hypothetical protein
MEALDYFENDNAQFAGNRFDRDSAIEFVNELYKWGAIKIEVVDIYDEDDYRNHYADTFMIYLPEDKAKRLDIMSVVCQFHPDEIDDDWNSNEPIRVWWD